VHSIYGLPCHEQLSKDLDEDAPLRSKLAELLRDRSLPPVYYDHPVVRRHRGRPVLPLALYLDAVPWSQTDSVLGFWLVCLISGRRYLYAMLRKQHACRCGCKGWCSLDPIFKFSKWSIEALANGIFPSARHDGSEWRPTDAARRGRAGQPMKLACACLYIKGDWSEFSGTLGLPSWQDALRPCYLCNASGIDMFVASGNSDASLRWRENDLGDYESACNRCMITVRLRNDQQRDAVAAKLRYDKRANGSKGRALVEPIARLGLEANDRLEPSATLHDVAQFDALSTPCTVVFWRPSAESLARHCNPLLVGELGLDPCACLGVDVLHAIHLGVLKTWARVAVWAALDSGIYGTTGTTDEKFHGAVLAFRAQLMQWYKQRHAQYPTEHLTRVGDFTHKMVGGPSNQQLKTKGAETWGIANFLIWLYDQYKHRLGAEWQRIMRAGHAIVRVVNIINNHKGQWVMPEAARKDTIIKREQGLPPWEQLVSDRAPKSQRAALVRGAQDSAPLRGLGSPLGGALFVRWVQLSYHSFRSRENGS